MKQCQTLGRLSGRPFCLGVWVFKDGGEMNRVYLYDGQFNKGDKGWPMVRAAAACYGGELGLAYDFEKVEICRTEKGKPFFVDIPVEFSLSHSGMMWMCLFADKPCGLDLQVVSGGREETRNRDRIVKGRYTPEEQHYVELWGEEGFYEIWVRKEAFGKCTGQGIFSEMPSMVDEKIDLKGELERDGVTYQMQAIEISPEVKCAVCMAADEIENIELRILG